MSVTLNKEDSVNGSIKIELTKADYEEKVENSLKDLRKSIVVDGFRKGMAPQSLLRQKYGKTILVEKLNELVSKSLSDFIKENNLIVLGEPLPSKEQAPIDIEKQENFVFIYDIGLAPKIHVELSKDDIIPYYLIQVPEEIINNQIEGFKTQYGNRHLVEDMEDKDFVKGKVIELDENGEPKTNGITIEEAVLMPFYMKNEEEKAKFLNAKLHSTLIFNPYKAYEGNETELASFLNIKKEETENCINDFSFEINEISRYKLAEVNQDLFDKVFGQGTIESEEAFREKVKEDLARHYIPRSDNQFFMDVRKLLEEKTSDMPFPDAFLKRWLLESDSNLTPESVEAEFSKIVKDYKFQLIKEFLIEENDIEINESEIEEYTRQATLAHFAKYGMYDVPADLLENYSKEMLDKKETYRAVGEKVFEDKLMKIWKEQVTLEHREITLEEFEKMLNPSAE